MRTRCVRYGQIEVGIIEHEGREFSALGASVVGRHITGYTKNLYGDIVLTSWCGKTILFSRSQVVSRFCDGSLALMFPLTNQRFIVGYALADDRALFRGQLLTDSDVDDARTEAVAISDRFAELDAEDQQEFELAG